MMAMEATGRKRGRPAGQTREEVRARRERMYTRYLECLSQRQVADEFGVDVKTVHLAVHREAARRGLRLEWRRSVQVVPVTPAA